MPEPFLRRFRRPAGAVAMAALLHALPAQALEFGEGELAGSFDTTLSHGLTWRVQEPDESLLSDVNGDDGNRNYDERLVSNTSKFTSDLDLGYRNFGAFARVTGFIDFENQRGARERTPLHPAAKDLVGRDFEVLDLYATGAFDLGDSALDLRLGKHVLNWGESTFIQNGINGFNVFDVSNLRLPGSELREAVVPFAMVSGSWVPNDVLQLEGFYQFDWEETVIDPVGTYFSVTDYVGPGATRAVIPISDDMSDEGFGFGPITPAINADLRGFEVPHPVLGIVPLPQPIQPDFDPTFVNVERGADRNPDDSGQWGAALRYFSEELNNTEFGLYFVNYHSRLPVVSVNSGTADGILAGLYAAQAVAGSPNSPPTNTVTAMTQAVTPVVTAAVTAEVTALVQAGLVDPADAPGLIATLVERQVRVVVGEEVGNIASALAIDRYAETGNYFIEYPEDIQLFGLSFNTEIGRSGWALQGEYSFRHDAPLQKAEEYMFTQGLAPLLRVLDPDHPDYIAPEDVPAYLATYQAPEVQGYIRRNVSQIQATATRLFGPVLGADSMAFITEVGLTYVHDLPDEDVLPIESPAAGADADSASWGYRLATRLDYNNAIGAVNLFPYLQFQHDVNGNSPSPGGAFVDGRTALTLGLRADYLAAWEANVGWTRYAGSRNELSDRDFVSASVKYSF